MLLLSQTDAINRYVPPDICNTIYSGIPGAQYEATLGLWNVPCDVEIDIALQFGFVFHNTARIYPDYNVSLAVKYSPFIPLMSILLIPPTPLFALAHLCLKRYLLALENCEHPQVASM